MNDAKSATAPTRPVMCYNQFANLENSVLRLERLTDEFLGRDPSTKPDSSPPSKNSDSISLKLLLNIMPDRITDFSTRIAKCLIDLREGLL